MDGCGNGQNTKSSIVVLYREVENPIFGNVKQLLVPTSLKVMKVKKVMEWGLMMQVMRTVVIQMILMDISLVGCISLLTQMK